MPMRTGLRLQDLFSPLSQARTELRSVCQAILSSVITSATSTSDGGSGKEAAGNREPVQHSPSQASGPRSTQLPREHVFTCGSHPLVCYFYSKSEKRTKGTKRDAHSCHSSHPLRTAECQCSCGKASPQETSPHRAPCHHRFPNYCGLEGFASA